MPQRLRTVRPQALPRFALAATAGVAALFVPSAATAQQQTLTDLDFENTPPPPEYAYGYTYAGGGFPQTDRSGSTSGAGAVGPGGNGGGSALVISGDFSGLSTQPPFPDYNYQGFGGGFGQHFFDFGTNTTLGLPSGDLSDYDISLDMAVAGSNAPSALVAVQMQFNVADDTFTTDADNGFDPFAQIEFIVPTGTDFATSTFNLANGNLTFNTDRVPEANRDFAAAADRIAQLNVNFNVDAASFGQDADNRLFVDNFLFTVVPEPASAALLGAAGLACLAVRRRR